MFSVVKKIQMKKIVLILLLALTTASIAIKCGVPELLTTRGAIVRLRPTLSYYYDSEQGHFRVWYDTTGDSAINIEDLDPSDGIPDWVQRAGEYLERSWACLVDTIGARRPIPDSDSMIDVYLVDLPNYYGATYLAEIFPDGTGPAYIEIENDFDSSTFPEYFGREEEALAVTCAHEFFHTIHYTYGFEEDWRWWMEATAVWSEERNYPEVNDYIQYIRIFQNNPERGLNENHPDDRIYGTVVFPIYITENYGDHSILDIWDKVPDLGCFGAISNWADSTGIKLNSLYTDFARWNLFVGDNYRGFGYPDAPLMEEPEHIQYNEIPESLTLKSGGSAIYIELPIYDSGGIWAREETEKDISSLMHAISIVGTDAPDTSIDISQVEDTLLGAWRFDCISIVLSNLSEYPNLEIIFTKPNFGPVTDTFVSRPTSDIERPPYPNPFTYGTDAWLYFPYSVEDDTPIRLSVWNSAGELVFDRVDETLHGFHLTKKGALSWYPRNMAGNELSSGIYTYFLAVEGKSYVGKFAIIGR